MAFSLTSMASDGLERSDGMLFEEALEKMRDGKKVRRKNWTSACIFIGKSVSDDGCIKETIYCGNEGSDRVHRVNAFDTSGILSDDWEVL